MRSAIPKKALRISRKWLPSFSEFHLLTSWLTFTWIINKVRWRRNKYFTAMLNWGGERWKEKAKNRLVDFTIVTTSPITTVSRSNWKVYIKRSSKQTKKCFDDCQTFRNTKCVMNLLWALKGFFPFFDQFLFIIGNS